MIFHTYIIYSITLDRYYTGHCQDLGERLRRYNNGNGASYTKKAKDWELKWNRVFESRPAAVKEEMIIKRKKSRKYIEVISKGSVSLVA